MPLIVWVLVLNPPVVFFFEQPDADLVCDAIISTYNAGCFCANIGLLLQVSALYH